MSQRARLRRRAAAPTRHPDRRASPRSPGRAGPRPPRPDRRRGSRTSTPTPAPDVRARLACGRDPASRSPRRTAPRTLEPSSVCGSPRSPASTRSSARGRISSEIAPSVGPEPFDRGVSRHRANPLSEDRARVELRVHQVDGQPDLLVALADRPRERIRAAEPRKPRRMRVDDAEARDREDLGRKQPRIAGAQPDLRLVRPREALEARLVGGEAEVEALGSGGEDRVASRDRIRVPRRARRDHGDGLDPGRAGRDVEPVDRRQHRRVDDRSHRRIVRPRIVPGGSYADRYTA